MAGNQLVVITGPIAAGKSTTAEMTGRCLRSRGDRVAVVDLADMYLIGNQDDRGNWEWNDPDTWAAARRASRALANSFFSSGNNVVIVEGGDFRTEEAMAQLLFFVRSNVDVSMFTLVVSYEEMFRRANGDPDRQPIKSDRGYKKFHASFASQLTFMRKRSDCINADTLTPDEISNYIADKIHSDVNT